MRLVPPRIPEVYGPAAAPTPSETPSILARIEPAAGGSVASAWLYYRPKSYGRFVAVPMLDDGLHGDGEAGDGLFGGSPTNYPAGTKVRYYVEGPGWQPGRGVRAGSRGARNLQLPRRDGPSVKHAGPDKRTAGQQQNHGRGPARRVRRLDRVVQTPPRARWT